MHAIEYPFIKILSMTKPKPNGLDQYMKIIVIMVLLMQFLKILPLI